MKFVSRIVALCAVFLLASAAFGQASEPYGTVEIEKFAVAQGVEFPENDLNELMSYMVTHFNKSRRFDSVFLSTDSAAQTASAKRVKITGTVVKVFEGQSGGTIPGRFWSRPYETGRRCKGSRCRNWQRAV